METAPKQQKDHDLLIEINTILKQVVRDIQDLKDGTSVKIADHEKRIESIERYKSGVESTVAMVSCHEESIKKLQNWKSSIIVYMSIYGLVGGFLAVLLISHLMGK